MSSDDGNPLGEDPGPTDPGADTAMFRAYVDQPHEPSTPAAGRPLVIGLVAAIVVLALVALVLVAS